MIAAVTLRRGDHERPLYLDTPDAVVVLIELDGQPPITVTVGATLLAVSGGSAGWEAHYLALLPLTRKDSTS
jgi:hypothetical protein